jgi:hypothetical protein
VRGSSLPNPATLGRPQGSRNKLSEEFFRDLYDAWEAFGKPALMTAAWTHPVEFVRVIADAERARAAMCAIGPERTFLAAPHMSAFGGKTDIAFCGSATMLCPDRGDTCGDETSLHCSAARRSRGHAPLLLKTPLGLGGLVC